MLSERTANRIMADIEKGVRTAISQAVEAHMLENSTLMTMEMFGKSVGVSKLTVQGWVNKRLKGIHTVKIGKHRMINVAKIKMELES